MVSKFYHEISEQAVWVTARCMAVTLPPARGTRDSLTRRLRFVQRQAVRKTSRLAASSSHSMCLATDAAGTNNMLLAWGSVGVQPNLLSTLPTPMPLPKIEVCKVAAGEGHCLLLTRDGSVSSWGADNAHGQLGHGDTSPRFEPQVIAPLEGLQIMLVACGKQHSLVLTSEGDVYSFGNGALGRLGLGGTADVHSPQKVLFAGRPEDSAVEGDVEEIPRMVHARPAPRLTPRPALCLYISSLS